MTDDGLQEVRERLIKIEVANNRISDLKNLNTWLWRAIAGALISTVIAFLIKF